MINQVVAIEGMDRMIRMLGHRLEQEFEVDRGEGDDLKLKHDVALNC